MEQEALYFDKNGIIKNAFHKNKTPTSINEVDIKRIVLSNKKPYGNKYSFKYFIGYIHEGNAFPLPLCIKLFQMNTYAKYFAKTSKYLNLSVNGKEILEKYNKICELWMKYVNFNKWNLIVSQCITINTLNIK